MTPTRGLARLLCVLTVLGALAACTAAAPEVRVPPEGADSTAGGTGPSVDTAAVTEAAPVPATGSGPVTTEDLLVLGEAMTRVLDGGDVEEWMALTDLDGEAAQQQRDWFAGVQAVPMEVREMHPTLLVRTDDGQGRATAQFAFRHQIRGVDAVPVLEEYELTLTPSGEDWLVTGVTGAGGEGSTYPQLWDLHPIHVAESGRTIVLYTGAPPARDELRAMDTAVDAVLDQLPLPGDPLLLVEYADAATLDEMALGDEVDWHSIGYPPLASPEVELVGHLPVVDEGTYGTPRLLVNRTAHEIETANYSGVRGGSPLTRSGVAYTVLSQRHLDFPALEWVDTGLAWWFEFSGDQTVRQSLEEDYTAGVGDVTEVTGFPPDSYWEFYADDSAYLEHQYRSATIMVFLEERYGRDVLVPLAEALALVDIGRHGAEDLMEEVFQDHLGAGRAEVEEAWVDWLHEEYADS